MSFKATWPGKCGGCGEPFKSGDQVKFVDDVILAIACHCDGRSMTLAVLSDTAESARRDRCPRCFIIHAGECM
jgi:hypothetical protein